MILKYLEIYVLLLSNQTSDFPSVADDQCVGPHTFRWLLCKLILLTLDIAQRGALTNMVSMSIALHIPLLIWSSNVPGSLNLTRWIPGSEIQDSHHFGGKGSLIFFRCWAFIGDYIEEREFERRCPINTKHVETRWTQSSRSSGAFTSPSPLRFEEYFLFASTRLA